MNTQEIAQKLLQRRNAMNPVVMPGEMIGTLGSEAMQEALQRRWLVPNQDTGLLQVSSEMAKVIEMRECAEKCEKCGCKECECKPAEAKMESHDFSVAHASRHPNFLHELLSPATGHDPQAGSAPAAIPPPAAPAAPTQVPASSGMHKPGVGDSVVVAEDGKVYTGTVGSMQGGRYKVTFGGTDKPKTNRDYADNEVKLVKPLNAATTR